MELKHLAIDKQLLHNVVQNREYNNRITDFYKQLQHDRFYEHDKIQRKIDAVCSCNEFFEIDYYKKQKVKDFKRTNLCKDKFCNNCKKVKQASRMAQFIPEIDKFKKHEMYHLVLTSPNVPAEKLQDNIKKQLKSFPRLIQYLKGYKKIRGLNFEKHGYLGAFRSLEVTYKNNSYHPHLHVLLIFENLEQSEKNIVNDYSYNHLQGGKLVRKFSDFEILIQKIWRLLLTGETVNKKNIDELKIGYSSMIDEFKEDDYFELFKYMTKNSSETYMTYENFITLHDSLYNVRQIQGYGCLFRLKDKDIENLVDDLYDDIIERLKEVEQEELIYETPLKLINDNENLLISRKKIHEHIRKIDKKNNTNSNK